MENPLVVTPNALDTEGQEHLIGTFIPGDTLYSFLHRHVPDIDDGEWVVTIGGRRVPVEMWYHTKPKDGQLIEVRSTVHNRSTWAIIAMLVLTYFTFGIGAYGGVIAGTYGTAAAAAVYVAGAILINKVLAPKLPSAGSQETGGVLNISGSRNQFRAYQPIPMLFGSLRITPDLASNPYSYFEGDDQYLAMTLLTGINVARIREIYNGDGLLSQYEGVSLWHSGYSGMPEQTIPLFTNVDQVAGGTLEAGVPIQRTTPANTVRIMADVEWQLFDKTSEGKDKDNQETIRLRFRPVGSAVWQFGDQRALKNRDMKTHRTALSVNVAEGQYEFDVMRFGLDTKGKGASISMNFVTGTSVQADKTNYSGFSRTGVLIKATGQLSGTPDELRMEADADPIQIWDGSQWRLATTRENGLSNPGAQCLAFMRGTYSPEGELLGGMGLSDMLIDIPAWQSYMLFCEANGYKYDYYLKDTRNCREVLNSILLAGFGQLTDAGGKMSVTWSGAEQPITAVVNMATIKKGQFQVDYSLDNSADGVEVNYYDRSDWSNKTLRIPAPGVETMLSPAQISPEGVTDADKAAEIGRFHLAQSLYQYKDISFSTDLEHLSYRRGSKLSLSHDLTQWGYSGSLRGFRRLTNAFELTLSADVVPPIVQSGYVGVRVPGEMTYRVFPVAAFSEETNTVRINQNWPADAIAPGEGSNNHPWDYLWCYDFKQSPGYTTRVISVSPEDGMKGASVKVVPESEEYWHFIKTGQYIPAPGGSLLNTRPIASNLKISENQVVQGDTIFTELSATFDVTGPYARAVILMSNDSAEMVEVAQTETRTATWRIPGAGVYTITVRPYNREGISGVAASVIYATIGAEIPPVNPDFFDVQQVSGGLRKYVWGFGSDTIRSADFAGVEIRHIAGSITNPDWSLMLPIGDTGYHAASFQSSVPVSGTWTFACRAVNTAGMLATQMLVITRTLGKNLGELMAELDDKIAQSIVDNFKAIEAEAQARADAIDSVIAQIGEASAALTTSINAETASRIEAIQQVTDGLLNEKLEREAAIETANTLRQSGDESLAQQISQISAGTGMQFDFKRIWYFDTTPEGWNGTVTSDGFLNPGNVLATSPGGLDVLGSQYRAIKTRVRRVGNPTWFGSMQYRMVGDSTWQNATVLQPAWDANGIGTIDLEDSGWQNGTLDQIRFQLANAVTADDRFEFDYIAIGRPTPGASVAMVQDETTARINGDAAEALQRTTLAVQMRGDYEGDDLAGLTQGLVYQERQARITEDESIVSSVEALSLEVDGKASAEALDAIELKVTEIDGELSVIGERVISLDAQLDTTYATDKDVFATDKDVHAVSMSVYTVIAEGDQALARQVNQVTADFGQFKSSVTTQIQSLSSELDSQALLFNQVFSELEGKASAQSVNLLSTQVTQTANGLEALAENVDQVKIDLDGKAAASAVNALQLQVTNIDGRTTSNANALTQVQVDVAGKAAASTVLQLSATVDSQGNLINSVSAQAFLSVNAQGYVGGFKIGNNGSVVDFTILADKLVIVSPQGGQRTEYSAGNWRVYDNNGTLRVRMGVW